MKLRASFFLLILFCAGLAPAQNESSKAETPSWKDEIAKGYIPYRQLTVEDLPVNDKAHPESAFTLKSFIHPRAQITPRAGDGFVDAVIDQWSIFSGLDRNESSRKSTFKEMKATLPYAQAFLDLNEIHARELAALKPEELPQTRATSFFEAQAELDRLVQKLVAEKLKLVSAEAEALAKATNGGADSAKVREKAAEIRKRLDALPKTTVPYPQPSSSGAASPAP